MFAYYLGQATLSAFVGTISYVGVTMTIVEIFGDDTEKGINGLRILGIMGFPFLIIVTLPLVLILAKIIKDQAKLQKVLLITVIIAGIILATVTTVPSMMES